MARSGGWRRDENGRPSNWSSIVEMVLLVVGEERKAHADFVVTAAHELRTPMTPLRALLLTMEHSAHRLTPERIREFAELMLASVERLEELMGNLVDLAVVDDRDLTPPPHPTDVRAAVALAVEVGCDPDQGHRVTVDAPRDAWAQASDRALRRMVQLLVENALRHTDGPVEVRVRAPRRSISVEVRDRGPGIPRDARARIFDRFARLGDVTTRATQGLGLGLAIAHGLARRYDGAVTVRDRPGGGAVFTLRLPAAEPGVGACDA